MTQLASDTSTAVVALADAFSATLTPSQRRRLVRAYDIGDARNWSNLPEAVLGRHGRVGLKTETLDDAQWAALDALLGAALGSGDDVGLDRVHQHLAADDHLRDSGGRWGYGRGEFSLAFLGTPSMTGTWELQFGGHHLAIANTYRDGMLAGATPSFRGIEPFGTFRLGGAENHAELFQQRAFATLLASLDPDQLAAARLPGGWPDLLLGPGRDWAFPRRPEGITAAQLSDDQRELLVAAIAGYVVDVADDDARRILDGYRRELDTTSLAFGGTPGACEVGDYVRIDGPSVWIEFSVHDGIVFPGPHPHAVWRDKRTDYGGRR